MRMDWLLRHETISIEPPNSGFTDCLIPVQSKIMDVPVFYYDVNM